MRRAIVAYALIVMAAALYTGARGGFHITTMTGFLPPHYGYSAYAVCVLPFLGPAWARYVAAGALLASGNRASWVGVIAGALWRRPVLAAVLGLVAVAGGLAWKPKVVQARTDSDRVMIWKSVIGVIRAHPEGVDNDFAMGVAGLEISHAHSDVLEIALRWGVAAAIYAVVAVVLGFCLLPAGPWRDVLVCLTLQSVIDNRLTTSRACLALYAAVWLAAALEAIRGLEPKALVVGHSDVYCAKDSYPGA